MQHAAVTYARSNISPDQLQMMLHLGMGQSYLSSAIKQQLVNMPKQEKTQTAQQHKYNQQCNRMWSVRQTLLLSQTLYM